MPGLDGQDLPINRFSFIQLSCAMVLKPGSQCMFDGGHRSAQRECQKKDSVQSKHGPPLLLMQHMPFFHNAIMTRSLVCLCLLTWVYSPLQAADSAPATTTASVAAPKNVSVDDADKLLKANPNIVVLDVRTADEFKSGHIPGAKNLDFFGDDFEKQIAALDKSKTYLVHCAAGGRSAKACKVIEKDQIPSVYHLNEGFNAWQKAGKPVEK